MTQDLPPRLVQHALLLPGLVSRNLFELLILSRKNTNRGLECASMIRLGLLCFGVHWPWENHKHAGMLVISAVSDFLHPRGLQPTRLLCPWDSPGKNTGVGCHALLQGIFLIQDSNPPSPALRVFFTTEPPGKLWENHIFVQQEGGDAWSEPEPSAQPRAISGDLCSKAESSQVTQAPRFLDVNNWDLEVVY